jgi:hypothetical protein
LNKRATLSIVLGALGAGVILLAAVAHLAAYPKPSLVAKSWQLDFTCTAPKAIAVRDSLGDYKWYWYLPYKVVNHSDAEQMFMPQFQIVTDEGDIATPALSLPPEVFEQIKYHLNNKYLLEPVRAIGKLDRGEDNARESVAVWPAPDHPILHMKVFVSGLSGETQSIDDPVTGQKVMLTKALMLEYTTPGKPPILKYQPVVAQGQSWVMR